MLAPPRQAPTLGSLSLSSHKLGNHHQKPPAGKCILYERTRGLQTAYPALEVHGLEVINRYLRLRRGRGGQKFLKLVFHLEQVGVLHHLEIIGQMEGHTDHLYYWKSWHGRGGSQDQFVDAVHIFQAKRFVYCLSIVIRGFFWYHGLPHFNPEWSHFHFQLLSFLFIIRLEAVL